MYCTKCGTENEATDMICKKCGAKLREGKIVQKKPGKKAFLVLAAALVFLICIIIMGTKRTPDIEQITSDLQEELKKDGDMFLDEQDFNIAELTIEKEEKGKKIYIAQIYVDYSKNRVEYQEKYILKYYRDKGWHIKDIQEYDTESWVMKPISAPSAEELADESFEYYTAGRGYYQTFEPLDEQEEPDLENGIANYYYTAGRETRFKKISAKVKMTYVFDKKYENWQCDSCSCLEENVEYHNLLHTWSGIEEDSWNGDKNIQIEITEAAGEDIKGKLYINDESHEMSGTISGLIDEPVCKVRMQGINDKQYYIDGIIWEEEGNFSGEIYTSYNPDATFYWTSDIYYIDLNMEN